MLLGFWSPSQNKAGVQCLPCSAVVAVCKPLFSISLLVMLYWILCCCCHLTLLAGYTFQHNFVKFCFTITSLLCFTLCCRWYLTLSCCCLLAAFPQSSSLGSTTRTLFPAVCLTLHCCLAAVLHCSYLQLVDLPCVDLSLLCFVTCAVAWL